MHQEFPTLSGRRQSQTNDERSQPEIAPWQTYQMCHIELIDHPRPVAAIAHSGKYYSLFKAGQPFQEAQAIAQRLYDQNETVVMTELPTGYAVWVLEPDAHLRSPLKPITPSPLTNEAANRASDSIAAAPADPFMEDNYVPCHVRVLHQSDRLSAIRIGNTYYSLFRIVTRPQQAIQIRDKLSDRGHKVVITRMIRGYALWVWEPDAALDSSAPSE
jgi:hypothetical protein